MLLYFEFYIYKHDKLIALTIFHCVCMTIENIVFTVLFTIIE